MLNLLEEGDDEPPSESTELMDLPVANLTLGTPCMSLKIIPISEDDLPSADNSRINFSTSLAFGDHLGFSFLVCGLDPETLYVLHAFVPFCFNSKKDKAPVGPV